MKTFSLTDISVLIACSKSPMRLPLSRISSFCTSSLPSLRCYLTSPQGNQRKFLINLPACLESPQSDVAVKLFLPSTSTYLTQCIGSKSDQRTPGESRKSVIIDFSVSCLLSLPSCSSYREISRNRLERLPEGIQYLQNLQLLFVSSISSSADTGRVVHTNRLKFLPNSIQNLRSLRSLFESFPLSLLSHPFRHLYTNKLTSLPQYIGNFERLTLLFVRRPRDLRSRRLGPSMTMN